MEGAGSNNSGSTGYIRLATVQYNPKTGDITMDGGIACYPVILACFKLRTRCRGKVIIETMAISKFDLLNIFMKT